LDFRVTGERESIKCGAFVFALSSGKAVLMYIIVSIIIAGSFILLVLSGKVDGKCSDKEFAGAAYLL